MPPCENEDRTSRGVGGCAKGDVSPSPPSGTVLLDGPQRLGYPHDPCQDASIDGARCAFLTLASASCFYYVQTPP